MQIDNRKFPRADIPCKVSTIFAERLLVFASHTENMGVGGIRVILEEKLQVSIIVNLELLLLDNEKRIKCTGQVVWVKEINPPEVKPRLFSTGIRFIDVVGSGREEIRKVVKTLLTQEGPGID